MLKTVLVPIDLPEWSTMLPEYALGAQALFVVAEFAGALPEGQSLKVLLVATHLDA